MIAAGRIRAGTHVYPPRYRLFVARIQAGTRTVTLLHLRIRVLVSTYLHLRIRTDTRMQIRRYKNVAVRIRVRKMPGR
ncbi:hypothetical protein DWY54_14040 [Parabacteroides distasonis]|nr:hypothetical protein DWY54_14040 [Parabacteroides distasonis]RHK56879.1 hypothetical protein DW056_06400 [Parabacteroides distasonis]